MKHTTQAWQTPFVSFPEFKQSDHNNNTLLHVCKYFELKKSEALSCNRERERENGE